MYKNHKGEIKMKLATKIIGSIFVITGGVYTAYYETNDYKTKSARIEANQATVLDAVGNKAKFDKIAASIDKNAEGLINLPIKQTLQDDSWEKAADKIKKDNAFADGKQIGIDSTQEAMNKLLKEKVQTAIDSVKKVQKAVVKKVKSAGKKGTKNAKNTKLNNKKHTNTVHKTIHKAAKKLVKQTSKHIKK